MDFPYIMPSKFHCIVIMKIHLIYSKTTLEFNNETSLLDHLEKIIFTMNINAVVAIVVLVV